MGRKLLILVIVLGLLVVGFFFKVPQMAHIQLPAETVAYVGPFPIVNSMVATWVTMIVLVLLSWAATHQIREVPGRWQGLLEVVVETLLGFAEGVAGARNGRKFFTIVASIFLFVLVNNWLGLLPLFGSLEVREAERPAVAAQATAEHGDKAVATAHETTTAKPEEAAAAEHGTPMVPLLRSASTDLNTTLALALVSVFMTQVYGIQALGLGSYGGKFINIKGGFIGIYVGVLELISEFAKIISFSFRLFGNIFAGEVLLGTMAFLIPWVASVPFMGLELFVGLIQAFVFAMLTLVFMTSAVASHDAHGEAHH